MNKRVFPALLCFCLCLPCGAAESYVVVGASKISEQTAQFVEKGEKCSAKHDYQGAVEAFRQACNLSPEAPELHVDLASVLLRICDYKATIAECMKAIDVRPKDPHAWGIIGAAYEMTGRNDLALAAYKKYLQLAPQAPDRQRYVQAVKELEVDVKAGKPTKDSDPNNYLAEVMYDGVHCWSKEKMPLKVHIASGEGVAGYRPEFGDIIRKSFSEWAVASNGKVSFVFVSDKRKSDIECVWSNDRSKFVLSDEAGQSIQTADEDGVVSADITIPCKSLDAHGDEIQSEAMHSTCLHEIGHAIGLHGHSLHPDDVMFDADVDFRKQAIALSKRDAATIQGLYDLKYREGRGSNHRTK